MIKNDIWIAKQEGMIIPFEPHLIRQIQGTWGQPVISYGLSSYGYDIHSKVYYTVACPLFDHDLSPAPGRELNLSVFKEVIKRYPELNNGGEHQRSEIFYSTSEEDEEEENDEDSSNS